MFSSLASLIFGSSATTNSDTNQNPISEREQGEQQRQQPTNNNITTNNHRHHRNNTGSLRIDAENLIEVTSTTPSVTGSSACVLPQVGSKHRSKRNRNFNNKNKRNGNANGNGNRKALPSITKLLTPTESCDEDFDDEDWFIVEREDDEEDSLPRSDSEEELSVVEVKPKVAQAATTAPSNTQHQHQHHQRRQRNFNSHSLYSGPRPQQQRNYLQRARNSGARSGTALSVSTLSPPRTIADASTALADAGITQSLYVVSTSAAANGNVQNGPEPAGQLLLQPQQQLRYNGCISNRNENGATNIGMEESWFVTPPPCFTSIGPINMETSPFENLLIEHPSMSVYHSIRSAQEAAESFVNLDLGVEEPQQQQQKPQRAQRRSATKSEKMTNNNNNNASATKSTEVAQQQPRSVASGRFDRFAATQMKQEMLARNTQKNQDKKERQNICRGAIKRANKVRDIQSKNNRQRRSDMQHCKVVSGANNNRKCCY